MKYIIFDIDGTLSDTIEVDDKCYIAAFQRVFHEDISNINWTDIVNLTDWGIAEELVTAKLERNITNQELEQLEKIHIDLLEQELITDDSQFNEVQGAKVFYDQMINHKEFMVGIGTGAWEESAKIKLNAIGIDPITEFFSNSNYYKSREAITQDVIHKMNSASNQKPDEIIYFGDGIWDYKTCRNLGIKFIGIDYKKNGNLKDAGAEIILHNFTSEKSIIEQYCS